jgi:hypothetical protein
MMDRVEDELESILDAAEAGLGFGLDLAEFISEVVTQSVTPIGEIVELVNDLAAVGSTLIRSGLTETLKDELACIGFCIMRNLNTLSLTSEILDAWFERVWDDYSPLSAGFFMRAAASLKGHQWLMDKYSLGINDCDSDWQTLCLCPDPLPDAPIRFDNHIRGLPAYGHGATTLDVPNSQAFDWTYKVTSWSGGWPSIEDHSGGREYRADIIHDTPTSYVTSITLRISPRWSNLNEAWAPGDYASGDHLALPVMTIRPENWGADVTATSTWWMDGDDILVMYQSPTNPNFIAKGIRFGGKTNPHIQAQQYGGRISIAAYTLSD